MADFGLDDEDDEMDEAPAFDPLASFRPAAPVATGLRASLADARMLAEEAQGAEDRSRMALYCAVSRAYDVSLAAEHEAEDFAALLEEHAIAVQPRAPMTPVVKLVFGADYDKSRLAEYAAVLAFAHREELEEGALAALLSNTPGGLKAVVAQERALRREERGAKAPAQARAERTHRQLGKLDARPLSEIPVQGAEYAICVIRRDGDGEIAFLGEVAHDDALLAKAATHLID